MRSLLHDFLRTPGFHDRSVSRSAQAGTRQVLSGEIRSQRSLRSSSDHSDSYLDVLATGRKQNPEKAQRRLRSGCAVVLEGQVRPSQSASRMLCSAIKIRGLTTTDW